MREARKERFRQFFLALGVAIILVSLPTIAVQGYDANKSQNDHHAASVKQQNQIISLQQQILDKDTAIRTAQMQNKGTFAELKTLAKESDATEQIVATVIAKLPGADAELGTFAAYSIAVNEAVCNDIIRVAAATGITLTACPAVPMLAPIS